mgnify:CR=1 FL=1
MLLSGGLDSSIIAALAARDSRVTTISMGFAESAIDERPFARTVAGHIGSDHHEVLIHHREMVEDLAEVVWYFDDLFADVNDRSGLILTFLALLEMIRLKLVRVFQSGSFGPIRVYKRARPEGAPSFEATNE